MQNRKNIAILFHKTVVKINDTVTLKCTATSDIHVLNIHIYILLHVITAFILQSVATFPDPLISIQNKKSSLLLFMNTGSQHENTPTCRTRTFKNMPAKSNSDLTHYGHDARIFFMHRSTGSLYES